MTAQYVEEVCVDSRPPPSSGCWTTGSGVEWTGQLTASLVVLALACAVCLVVLYSAMRRRLAARHSSTSPSDAA
jgi:hypothetical protein